MIAFDEALRRIVEAAQPLGSERIALDLAAGRVLAAPVAAQADAPTAHRSAMDGYAVRDADLPGTLRVIGESAAGRGFAGPIAAGTCVRIFTGAAVPSGADRVVIQEDVTREGEQATFGSAADAPRFIRLRGSDFRAGEELVAPGRRLSPQALVTVAGAGLEHVEVWRRPRTVILATGDELAPPAEARSRPDMVPESASYGVAALATEWGANVLASHRLLDDLPTLLEAAAEAVAQADLAVVIGGASVGDKDFAKAMFGPLRLDLMFSKVAMKPGKPVWFGRCGSTLVLGLPGNPTSAMVTARLLLCPLVAGLCGRDGIPRWRSLPLAGPLPAVGDRETFARARRTPQGALPANNQDSGAQGALACADLLLRCPPHGRARTPGELVDALTF